MKNKIVITFFILIIFSACSSIKLQENNSHTLDAKVDELVTQIINTLSDNNKSKIAIIEFSDLEGNITNLGRYVAEELTTKMYRTNQFEVVERQLMNKLIQEQNLSLQGYIDIDTEVGIGKVLGVDAIVSGSITDLGTNIKINARLISPESGKVFSVASVKIVKDETIRKLLNQQITTSTISGMENTSSKQIIDKNGLNIEVVNATILNRTVTITMNLINKSENDIDFSMIIGSYNDDKYSTMIYDNLGNECRISGIKLGNNFTNLKNSVTQYAGASKKIVAGISVKAELQFEKVSSEARTISLLQINAGRGNMIEFRDIKIQ
jgi:TolB-like protein